MLYGAFCYNSAESELIWMKSGALWAHRWGLALADFGRYPRSSDSLRGSRNFVPLSSKNIYNMTNIVNFRLHCIYSGVVEGFSVLTPQTWTDLDETWNISEAEMDMGPYLLTQPNPTHIPESRTPQEYC